MYAVIKTGGKQYRVFPGQKLKVEKLDVDVGQEVVFDQVLMTGGEVVNVGSPVVEDASVRATVESQERGNKIMVYKSKRRTGYHKKQGHRQEYTLVRVDRILQGEQELASASPAAPEEDALGEKEADQGALKDEAEHTESEEE